MITANTHERIIQWRNMGFNIIVTHNYYYPLNKTQLQVLCYLCRILCYNNIEKLFLQEIKL